MLDLVELEETQELKELLVNREIKELLELEIRDNQAKLIQVDTVVQVVVVEEEVLVEEETHQTQTHQTEEIQVILEVLVEDPVEVLTQEVVGKVDLVDKVELQEVVLEAVEAQEMGEMEVEMQEIQETEVLVIRKMVLLEIKEGKDNQDKLQHLRWLDNLLPMEILVQ